MIIVPSLWFKLSQKDPRDMKWFNTESWEDCPDCKGSGEIDISNPGEPVEFIRCPCAEELR